MSTVEAEILSRVVAPDRPTLEPDAAKAILGFRFPASDRQTMDKLSEKAREGELSESEREQIDSYERIGHLISLMKSKARLSLNQAP